MTNGEIDHEAVIQHHDIEERIYNHDATQMEFHLNSLWSAHYTLVGNYRDFQETLDEYEATGEEIFKNFWDVDDFRFKIPKKYTPEEAMGYVFEGNSPDIKEEPFIFSRRAIRSVNNYATSAYSLYDNAQEFRKKWVKPDFQDRYYGKLNEFNAGPVNDLILDIRRYTTHYRGVPLALNQQWDENNDTHHHLSVSKEKLKNADCLKPSSEEYVDRMPEEGFYKGKIRVGWVIQQHFDAINPFYNWLVEKMYDSYSDEFEELEELKAEAEELREQL